MLKSKTTLRKILLSFFLGITIFVWYAVLAEKRDGLLTVAFLDVGQGDAIFIEAPNGKQVLVDAGPNKKVLRELAKQMPFYDRSIDVIVMTHPDNDHIGGFPAVLNFYDVGVVLKSEVKCANSVCNELNKQIKEKSVKEKIARRGMVIDLDDNIYLQILFPDRDTTNFETNTASIVMKLVYGDSSFLLTGDSPEKIEEYLVFLNSSDVDADVLKLGHHGSKTSTSELFVGYVNPEIAVISAGGNNRYGHPHQEVLDLLKKFEIKFFCTGEEGTIVVKSDGKKLWTKF